jgi:hypothetical protein
VGELGEEEFDLEGPVIVILSEELGYITERV